MDCFEAKLLRYFQYLDSKSRTYNFVAGLIWMAVIGLLDNITPGEVRHSYLYLLPIAFVTWFSGIRCGLVISLLSTALWSVNNIVDTLPVFIWNIASTLIFYVAVTILFNKTRTLWENEKTLSRTDPLTGAKNIRAFAEIIEHEMLRSSREDLPFSMAYLDLDNFKNFNDTYGHVAGDELLKSIVANIMLQLRKTDVVGRLGGDEFAIFFPATDQSATQVVMQKISHELDKLMGASIWSITFSVGVLTCTGGVHNLEKLISFADGLMYEVKRAGKNDIRYALYPPTARSEKSQEDSSLLA